MVEISVIIPTYNQKPEYLAECIKSAINQTFPRRKYEIIVVDDGGKDDSARKVAARYKVKYIRKENGGTASALNFGIGHMRGEYFKWLSSDDALCENSLETFMKYANKTRKKIFYADWFKMDEKGKIFGEFFEEHFDSHVDFCKTLWKRYIGNATAAIIHRSCFEKVGLFDEEIGYAEDYLWWLKAAIVYGFEFVHIPEKLAKYRIHSSQLSQTLSVGKINRGPLKSIKIKEKVLGFIRRNDLEKQLVLPLKELKISFVERVFRHIVIAGKFLGIRRFRGYEKLKERLAGEKS